MPKDSKALLKFKEKHGFIPEFTAIVKECYEIMNYKQINLFPVPYLPCFLCLVHQHVITVFGNSAIFAGFT